MSSNPNRLQVGVARSNPTRRQTEKGRVTEKSYGGERGIQRTITRFDRFGGVGGGGKKGEMRDLCRNWRRRKRGIAWFLLLSSCVSRIKRTLALARCVLCYGFGGSLCCSCGFLRLGKTYVDDGDDGGYAYITCLVGSLGRDTPDAFNWNTAKSKITETVWLKERFECDLSLLCKYLHRVDRSRPSIRVHLHGPSWVGQVIGDAWLRIGGNWPARRMMEIQGTC